MLKSTASGEWNQNKSKQNFPQYCNLETGALPPTAWCSLEQRELGLDDTAVRSTVYCTDPPVDGLQNSI